MLPELLHAHHSAYRDDLPFWLDLAARMGDPVLELGCGSGRVLVPLARAGSRVTGIDRQLSILEYLNSNLDASLKPFISLFAADIGNFNLAAGFPLVILPCNTFSTLDAQKRKACLRCIWKALLPGGVFAVSIPNPELLMRLPARSEAMLEDEFLHPASGNPMQVSSSWQRTKTTFTVTWMYDHLIPDGKVERQVVKNVQWLTSLESYKEDFHNTGFEVTEIFGDFDCSLYRDDSPQLIFIARPTSVNNSR